MADPRFDELEPELPPVPENFENIRGSPIGPTTNVRLLTNNINNDRIPRVTLVGRDNPQFAYAEMVGGAWPRNLGANNDRPDNWGQASLAVVYPRVGENTFQVPESAENATYVIIKRLNKSAIREYQEMGGRENPRKEVARMLEFGDDIHVLSCFDFLEDDQYIYIITKKGQSLLDWVNSEALHGREIFAHQAEMIFSKILRILDYLRFHNICHHDISPDNFLFIEPDGVLVAFDLAMSIRWQVNAESNVRHRIYEEHSRYGTPQCMTPEVYDIEIRPYDGVQLDVWGAVVTFNYLLMGDTTFQRPDLSDPLFRVFVFGPEGGGFASMQVIQDAQVILYGHERANLQLGNRMNHIWNAIATLTPDQRLVFFHSYQVDPNERWSLDQLLALFE